MEITLIKKFKNLLHEFSTKRKLKKINKINSLKSKLFSSGRVHVKHNSVVVTEFFEVINTKKFLKAVSDIKKEIPHLYSQLYCFIIQNEKPLHIINFTIVNTIFNDEIKKVNLK